MTADDATVIKSNTVTNDDGGGGCAARRPGDTDMASARPKTTKTSGTTQAERLQASSQQRREQQKENLRGAILAAAGELFLEQGYEAFSMRQVAERIGYSATTIYRYYEDKDDLLFAIVHEGFSEFQRALVAAAESTADPIERLVALGAAYVRFGMDNPVHYRLMFMQRFDFVFDQRKARQQPMIDSFNVLQDAVASAMDAGAMQRGDVERHSQVVWALVHGITALGLADRGRFTADDVDRTLEIAMKMMVRGLRP
ncbi:TetR/AcrR family transcriptional regulator [Sorangium sp. So ce327]|uniref:TetR/AcrR family transcriptional regulator n=1 Tax=Sorangium sp. So ce327 TaxID=3133301 RepID=UPI003F639DEE